MANNITPHAAFPPLTTAEIEAVQNEIDNNPLYQDLPSETRHLIVMQILIERKELTIKNQSPPTFHDIAQLGQVSPQLAERAMSIVEKRHDAYAKADVLAAETKQLEVKNNYLTEKLKSISALIALTLCLVFLAFPISLGRADISLWAAACFTAIAVILSVFNKQPK